MRLLSSASLLVVLVAVPASAGPVSHALETGADGSILLVDLERARLLRWHEGELSVLSALEGVPAGDARQNLISSIDGEIFLGVKKSVFRVLDGGGLEATKPPAGLKNLFRGRPADLAPDGSVFVAADFKQIERSLPGGDTHPVLINDTISRIHSMAVTPYGRVFFSNSSEIAKLKADGSVEVLLDVRGDTILGLAALGENECLLLRQDRDGRQTLERLDNFGNVEVVVTAEQISNAV